MKVDNLLFVEETRRHRVLETDKILWAVVRVLVVIPHAPPSRWGKRWWNRSGGG